MAAIYNAAARKRVTSAEQINPYTRKRRERPLTGESLIDLLPDEEE